MKKLLLCLFCFLILFTSGCQTQPINPEPPVEDPPQEPIVEVDPIQELLDSMTLTEKIGQMFIIRPESITSSKLTRKSGVKKVTDEIRSFYEKYPAGGFCLFAKNVSTPSQLTELTAGLHSLNTIIPLITIDEEGGSITRIASNKNFNVKKYPKMGKIANAKNYALAKELGVEIGKYLNTYGVDLDFAPVADVNTNPKNTVICMRAFGSNPYIASDMIVNVMNGLHQSGVMCCLKHFPGHGDTLADTHKGYSYTNKTWEEMLECEMITFTAGIEAGTDMIMVAHIAAPNVTGDKTPATLSYMLVTEKLRNELGYDGVIITDSMEMGAITKYYGSAQSSVLAIQAGVDIVLMPSNYVNSFNAVLEAVNNGDISQERIDQSVYRILSLKAKLSQQNEK